MISKIGFTSRFSWSQTENSPEINVSEIFEIVNKKESKHCESDSFIFWDMILKNELTVQAFVVVLPSLKHFLSF